MLPTSPVRSRSRKKQIPQRLTSISSLASRLQELDQEEGADPLFFFQTYHSANANYPLLSHLKLFSAPFFHGVPTFFFEFAFWLEYTRSVSSSQRIPCAYDLEALPIHL
jgi:hypothetical protein